MILELPNISLIMEDVPGHLFSKIDQDVDSIIAGTSTSEKITSALSAPGVPAHYRLNDDTEQLMKDYVFSLADQYSRTSLYLNSVNLLRQPAPYHFNRPWVNLQRAGEFLPNHIHEGLLSYVIWVKIPDVIQNSQATAVEGKFEFTYNNILGTTIGHNVSLDRSYIGKILMFPASLRHCVYPFKGDDVRVSVSGNILLG
jgi:hypothetical protein